MLIYTLRRINLFVITLLIISVVSYSILRLDPTSTWSILDFWEGWRTYLSEVTNLNFGLNASGRPISDEIFVVFAATLELCLLAFLLALIIGIPLGTLSGVRRGKPLDKFISFVATAAYAAPLYWIALLLMLLLSLQWELLPVSGRYNPLFDIETVTGFAIVDTLISPSPHKGDALQSVLLHLVLPCCVLAIPPATQLVRLMRSSVAQVMSENFIRVAKIRGLSSYQIIVKHVLRNAFPPIIPMLGVQLASMLTFAIITESIFSWPGIGRWLLDALAMRDYVSIQAGVLVVASFVLFTQILSDLIGTLINPLARKEWYVNR